MRHSHERIKVLEERTAPPKVDKAEAEAAAAAAGLYGGGYMMNDTLMIANSAYGKGYTYHGKNRSTVGCACVTFNI